MDWSTDGNDPVGAFRAHRHDVQNHLQLVKAYIQLNRTQDALRAVDRLARWLTSLSMVQNLVGESAPTILWAAARCPNVVVQYLSGSDQLYAGKASTVVNVLMRLQAAASEHGVSEVGVSVRVTEGEQRVRVQVPAVEDIRQAWNTGDVDDLVDMEWMDQTNVGLNDCK